MNAGLRLLIRIELFLFAAALFAAAIYYFTEGAETALYIFLGCLAVPQPFLIHALRKELFRKG